MNRRMVAGACALALTLGSAGIARADDPPPAPDPPNSDALINIGVEGIARLGVNGYVKTLLPICVSLRIGPSQVIPWTRIPGPAA